ncbi:MAG TPA: hypothetical protein VI072_17290 [Polyangiaceae bacterium]
MDAATLIERINRDIQEQEPTFEALREALWSCDPRLQFAVPRDVLASFELSCAVTSPRDWKQHNAALYGVV